MLNYLRTYNDRGLGRLLALAVALAVALLVALVAHSCRNPGNFTINGRTEIERFMMTNEDIRELFDLNVYARDTFALDSGGATFRVARIEGKTQGNIRISASDDSIKTSFGASRFAIVDRTDRFKGTFTQADNPSGSQFESFYDAILTRRVLFLKLGGDGDRFFGWEFVGLDLGKSLPNISAFVTIRKIPAQSGFSTILSDQTREIDLEGDLQSFTFLFHVKSVKAGDSIDIRTKNGAMTIFARTNVGFRQLTGRHNSSESALVFHYGFRTPPADPQNQFYHLLTFQQGPIARIDSLNFRRFILTVNETAPADTQIITFKIEVTTFDSLFNYRDTCVDTLLIDTTILDTCSALTLTSIDIIIDSVLIFDTSITPAVFDTIYDSTLLAPDTTTDFEDLWVFPYSVVN